MQSLTKATVLGLGLLTSGTAIADDNYGSSSLYNPQHGYNSSPSYYGPSPTYIGYYDTDPHYYPGYSWGYGYPAYGWYAGTPYVWPQPYGDPYAPGHPYSKTPPNWVPYSGWR
jgi:hypothetical protein